MRIINENFKENSKTLIPDNLTDLFILSRLIESGDLLTGKTHRRIRRSGEEGREGNKGERIPLTLTILVTETNFQDNEVDNRLRVKGKIKSGPEDLISLGSSHTINISIGSSIILIKEDWTPYHIKLINDTQKNKDFSPLGLIVLEYGVSTFAILDNYKLNYISNENKQLPGKKTDNKTREKYENNFFSHILQSLKNQTTYQTNTYIIGSPGNIKNKFYNFIKENWDLKNKQVYLEHVSSGTRIGIEELMTHEVLTKIAANFEYIKIEKTIREFEIRLVKNQNKVGYGINNVLSCLEMSAVDVILILDTLFRTKSSEEKELVKELFKLAEQTKAELFLVDNKTNFGKKIESFGKVIALLRFDLYFE